jgi:hypothetical protein
MVDEIDKLRSRKFEPLRVACKKYVDEIDLLSLSGHPSLIKNVVKVLIFELINFTSL